VLSGRQQRLIAALVLAPSIRAACQRCRVPERTYRDWARQGEFAAALESARGQAVAEALGQLKTLLARAVAVMGRAMRAKDEATRLRAAQGVFDRVIAAGQLEDLRRQVEELAAALNEKGVTS
jgi:hypothetical protein